MNETLAVSEIAPSYVRGPDGCPICWDHDLEKLDNVQLYHGIVYRCSSWHVFAVFERE